MGGDVGRAFKETLSLEELNLTNCGGYKLKGLRVARLSGTNKVYDGPHRVPSTPKRHVEIQSSHDYSVMMEGEEREREKERERGNVDVPQNSKGKRREGAAGGRHTRSDQRSRSGDNRRHRMRHRESGGALSGASPN